MVTLMLFRHAKSAAAEAGMKDIARPLTSRGEKAASAMGKWLLQLDLRPDLVLSSTSTRTRATCELAFSAFQPPLRVEFDNKLYLASARTLLNRVRRVGKQAKQLVVVGHNPGLHDLANDLVGRGPAAPRADLEEKLPTGAIVIIRFDGDTFADVDTGRGTLLHFGRPKQILSIAEKDD